MNRPQLHRRRHRREDTDRTRSRAAPLFEGTKDRDAARKNSGFEAHESTDAPHNMPMPALQKWIANRPAWFVKTNIDIDMRPDGWDQLLDFAMSAIQNIVSRHPISRLRVTKISRKNGALSILISDRRIQRHLLHEIRKIMMEVHKESKSVCEHCGSHGTLGSVESELSVRCDQCAPPRWRKCVY